MPHVLMAVGERTSKRGQGDCCPSLAPTQAVEVHIALTPNLMVTTVSTRLQVNQSQVILLGS